MLDDTEYFWTKEELGKLASGNIIRVLSEVENVRDALSYEEPYQVLIPVQDLKPNTGPAMPAKKSGYEPSHGVVNPTMPPDCCR